MSFQTAKVIDQIAREESFSIIVAAVKTGIRASLSGSVCSSDVPDNLTR